MKSVNELKAPLSAIFTPLIGEFRIKTYFSYYGIFKDKIMLALYKDEQLYLRIAKTDLEEIKLLPNTLLLEDPNVGLATKCFYKITSAFWESTNFAQWVKNIIHQIQSEQEAILAKQRSQIRSLPNMNINLEKLLKRVGIFSVDDLRNTGEIATFIKLIEIGIDGSDQLLFRLHGAIHSQNIYSFSHEKKMALLQEANQAFYKVGLRHRFRLPKV